MFLIRFLSFTYDHSRGYPTTFLSLVAAGTLEMDSLDDRSVLLEFFRATNGPSWKINDGWDTSENVSTWYGVEVDADGRVLGLNLPDDGIKGEASRALLLVKWQMATAADFTAPAMS